MEELEDYVFDIRHVPGHLNSAADALSRLNGETPLVSDEPDSEEALPDGLMLNGSEVPGGGDSLFESLLRTLKSTCSTEVSDLNVETLRERLVDEVKEHSSKYKITLNSKSRKKLDNMRLPGRVPSLDLLIAASYLFKVQILVYLWGKEPIVFQYDNYDKFIHIKCRGGVHFDPLIEVMNYDKPKMENCIVYSIKTALEVSNPRSSSVEEAHEESDTDSEFENLVDKLLTAGSELSFCEHKHLSMPEIFVSIGNAEFCAVLDSGAEISLVNESVLDRIKDVGHCKIKKERLCDIIGFTGGICAVEETVELQFELSNYTMSTPYKFGIVKEEILPHCMLLGIDFLSYFKMDLNFDKRVVEIGSVSVSRFMNGNGAKVNYEPLFMMRAGAKSHQMNVELSGSDVKFSISGNCDDIGGLSMLMDSETIKRMQSTCSVLRQLRRNLLQEQPVKQWSASLKQFKKHGKNLAIVNDTLVYGSSPAIPIVPFKFLVEMVIQIHFGYAHIGRDKMLNLLYDLVWHPSKYRTVSDICTTCHACQVMKNHSTQIIPPTLKITTNYPFELMAADLLSLPTTRSGFVACLVVVDHNSKWLSVVPLKNKTSKSVVDAFSRQILPFLPSVPTNLLTDNGREFIAADFKEFLVEMGINQRLTTPYCPTSNGAVERVNQTVQKTLSNLIDPEEPERWDEHLPKAVVVYNNTLHSQLGMSPAKYLMTKSHSTTPGMKLGKNVQDTWKVGHPKFSPFKTGEYVLVKIPHKGFLNINKLSPGYVGPFLICNVHENGLTYELKNLRTDALVRGHHSKLRLYKLPPSYLSKNLLFRQKNGTDNLEDEVGQLYVEPVSIPVVGSFSSTSDSSSDEESVTSSHEQDNVDVSSVCSSFSGFLETGEAFGKVELPGGQSALGGVLNSSFGLCRGCYLEAKLEKYLYDIIGEREQILSDVYISNFDSVYPDWTSARDVAATSLSDPTRHRTSSPMEMADWEWSNDEESDIFETPGGGDIGGALGRNCMSDNDDNHMIGGHDIQQLAIVDSVVTQREASREDCLIGDLEPTQINESFHGFDGIVVENRVDALRQRTGQNEKPLTRRVTRSMSNLGDAPNV